MKKRIVVSLLSVVFAASNVCAQPLVLGQYSDINSCQVIYHDGSQNFTYGNAGQDEDVAGTNEYGSSKTLKNYKGYELRCQANLDHRQMATVSLPVGLSDFSSDVQAQLKQLPTLDVAKEAKEAKEAAKEAKEAAAAAREAAVIAKKANEAVVVANSRSISLTSASQVNGALGIARDELVLYRRK